MLKALRYDGVLIMYGALNWWCGASCCTCLVFRSLVVPHGIRPLTTAIVPSGLVHLSSYNGFAGTSGQMRHYLRLLSNAVIVEGEGTDLCGHSGVLDLRPKEIRWSMGKYIFGVLSVCDVRPDIGRNETGILTEMFISFIFSTPVGNKMRTSQR